MASKAHAFQQACRAHSIISKPPSQTKLPSTLCTARQSSSNAHTRNTASGTTRRAITVTSDDGRYAWSELSAGEKAARTTQQSFNFLLVGAGAIGVMTVSYLLYAELFASDSKTRQFNRAVDRIRADPRCRELLGPADQITAYGEPTSNKWARARPLAHSLGVDRYGITHFKMHFNVEGPDNKGQVQVHMTKRQDQDDLEYKLLSVTIPGHQTIYLENANTKGSKKSVVRIFGMQWGK